ncbi:toxin VasX [Pseudomonas sp. DNDY-54]|uniref:toxin VasX n=1 Tax=Pseudomonas sp. DNDY-54 TaxID=2870860 RepID=UPI001CA3997D|nr:toxin VasX [Pseudomonas sp. DNDY-54]
MNQAVAAPASFTPASCPLLAAVLPLRYAIGPIAPQSQPSSIDAQGLGLPAITGHFPELGPDHPVLGECAIGYVPRVLRDGWLYVWQSDLKQMSEYQVEGSNLQQTPRGGPVLDKRGAVYLMLPAGTPVMMVWSPVRWSDSQFAAAKAKADVRQRIMREIIPGAAPLSGQVTAVHRQIGDLAPSNYSWSCAPSPQFWRLDDPRLHRMQRCEQQHYGIVDDPWGVLLDLAGLLRARNKAYDKLCHYRRDEWAIATTLESLSEGDEQLRKELPTSTDYPRLQRVLKEQKAEADAIDADRRRLASLWAEWFTTLGQNSPSSLESACGHFDITQPDARDAVEASFAAACLGPSATGIGVKVIEQALNPESSPTGKPWLVWAVLGVAQRIGGGELKQLLHVPENVEPITSEVKNLARAITLVAALNHGADNLQRLSLAKAGEALSAAMSPVLGGHLRTLTEHVNQAAMTLMIAMLTRSQQRLEVMDLSQHQSMLWLTEQMNQAHNKGQRRRWQKELQRLEAKETRVARQRAGRPGMAPIPAPVAKQVQAGIPHLRVVPKPQPAPPHPGPGYGSEVPHSPAKAPPSSTPNLPPLPRQAAQLEMPKNIGELMDEAPLKTLIALVATWNLYKSTSALEENRTGKSAVSFASAALASATAVTAVIQKMAEVDWKTHTNSAGKFNPTAQKLLANALGRSATTMVLQAVTAGIDAAYFGWEALDSYKAGDLDSATIQVGLSGANLAYMRVSLQMFRALRIARAAVIAGDAFAIGRGTAAIPAPLLAQTLGLVITILGGLIALWYTKDTPLESWVKQTRFGIRPADWSGSYEKSMIEFYQMVMPVKMELKRWTDRDPRTFEPVREIRLFLILPGQKAYSQGMLSFSGSEEWERESGLLSFGPTNGMCIPLVWGEDDQIPFDLDVGSRITAEPGGGVRLRKAYHESDTLSLKRISGTLIYQPIEGLFLPPINIDLS